VIENSAASTAAELKSKNNNSSKNT